MRNKNQKRRGRNGEEKEPVHMLKISRLDSDVSEERSLRISSISRDICSSTPRYNLWFRIRFVDHC